MKSFKESKNLSHIDSHVMEASTIREMNTFANNFGQQFSPVEQLIIAVAENDLKKFARV